MVGLLIAVFFGWLGGWRFYKKQFKLGILYLLTFGLFGIGWIIDIIKAVKEMPKDSFSMDIEIKGAWAECKKNPSQKRTPIIECLEIGTPLGVEISTYEGAPFYQILSPDGLDIGAFPSAVSKMILNQYPHARITATLSDKKDPEHPFAHITVKR